MKTTTDFSEWKFRASQTGKLMTGISVGLTENQEATFKAFDDRYKGIGKPLTENQIHQYFDMGAKKHGDKIGLSKGTLTHLEDVHKGATLRRKKDIGSKYTEKGIVVEEKSITLYSDVTNTLFIKNENNFSNDFVIGTPDMVKSKVIDIKSSWSFDTFPLYDEKTPSIDYEYQLLTYMWLTGVKEAELAYCLVDTPYKIINDELRRLDWKYDVFDGYGDIRDERKDLVIETISNLLYTEQGLIEYCNQSTSNLKIEWFDDYFTEIPKELRLKVFEVQYDQAKINALIGQIKLSREYLNNLSIKMSNQILKS